jgi:hypothetical protein
MSTKKKSTKRANAAVAAVRRSAEQRRRQKVVNAHLDRAEAENSYNQYKATRHIILAMRVLNNL